MITLRPYQERTIGRLFDWFLKNPQGHPIVDATVGAGKALMIAELCRRALQWPNTRILMCVASRELCRQNAERLLAVWPEAPVGVYSAGLKQKQMGTPILYATIGSVWKRWHELGHIDLILIDECHNVSAKDRGMYRSLISNLMQVCPHVRAIGWTGTPFYGNGVWLHDDEDALFTDIAARVTMRELLDTGYLSPLATPPTTTRLSADGVKQRDGDYVVSQLAQALDQDHLVQACANELVATGAERKRWFVYGVTVDHATHIRDALRSRAISAEVVSANTPHGERDAHLAALEAGRLRAIVNVATMTTGIDVPELDLIALMRNTRSPVLYCQIAGRGMRPAPGKEDCLFVDFTDTVQQLGPVDLIKGRTRRKSSTGSDMTRICPECGAVNPISARLCWGCDHEFEIIKKQPHNVQVSDAPILSVPKKKVVERFAVKYAVYQEWQSRNSGTKTLRVDYHDDFVVIASEWVCLEHQGFAKQKAHLWWAQRAPCSSLPTSVSEAWQRRAELAVPSHIHITTNTKYPEIIRHEFSSQHQDDEPTGHHQLSGDSTSDSSRATPPAIQHLQSLQSF